MMLRIVRSIAFALPILVVASGVHAEPAEVLEKYVQALARSNTASLKEVTTTEQYRSIVDDNGGLSKDFKFVDGFGIVKKASIKETKSYSSFTVYVAEVDHTRARTTWMFRLDDGKEKIASAVHLSSKRKSGIGIFGDILTNLSDISGSDDAGIVVTTTKPIQLDEFLKENFHRREVDFLFATDRTPAENRNMVSFSGVRNPSLAFGAVTVRVPEDHKMGRVELPSVWKLFSFEIYREKQNDKKHFSLKRAAILTEKDFESIAREHNKKNALIFVHGFNNSFEAAVYRNAQMLWDLQYEGLPVLYAWSSKGDGVSDYGFDRDSALYARDGFIKLVQKLQNDLGIERVDVLAHSMGNFLVVDALSTNAITAKPVQLDQLVMAAPDIELEGFRKSLPMLKKVTKGMTLYASSADKALVASSTLQKFPRAGAVPPEGPIHAPGLDTIDVSRLGDEFLGLNHSTFAENRAVMDDLKLLLFNNMRPPRLSQIRPVPLPPQPMKYWRYE